MRDIYCSDDKCPICDGKVQLNIKENSLICANNCYFVQHLWTLSKIGETVYYVSIIIIPENKRYKIFTSSDEEVVRERIKYWKENDRYLMAVLTDGE